MAEVGGCRGGGSGVVRIGELVEALQDSEGRLVGEGVLALEVLVDDGGRLGLGV